MSRGEYGSEYTDTDEGRGVTSDDSGPGSESDLFGSLKTLLAWDGRTKQPSVVMRQFVESAQKIELKYKVWGGIMHKMGGCACTRWGLCLHMCACG